MGIYRGLLHDTGKYSEGFQAYLKKTCDINAHIEQKYGRVDHSSFGAQQIASDKPEDKLIAYCIAGHHSGLLDGNGNNGATLEARLSKEIPRANIPDHLLENLPVKKQPISICKDTMHFQLYLFTKMLYSCLVDADFLDTEAFMNENRSQLRSKYPALSEISEKFWPKVDKLQNQNKSLLNKTRH